MTGSGDAAMDERGYRGVVGHKDVIRHLVNAAANDKVSHAYLLTGEKGSGKKLLASIYAAALCCETHSGEPCFKCASCHKALTGNHPDIIRVIHERSDVIRVNEIREQLVNTVDIKPYESRYKIYIVADADKMNPQAQNALLKLLEEPPSSACFILAAENAAALLPTVRSRCELLQQNAEASPIPEAALTQARAYIAALSSGSRARLVRWCNDREKDDYDAVRALFDALRQLCAASLAGESTLPDETAYALLERLDQCQLYLKANVGLKHIFGLLSLPCGPGDDETELRKSH
jgi:DNA polymerase III delta' subunit